MLEHGLLKLLWVEGSGKKAQVDGMARHNEMLRDRSLSSAEAGRSSILDMRTPNPSPALHNMFGPNSFYLVLGLGSGGRLLGHFSNSAKWLSSLLMI